MIVFDLKCRKEHAFEAWFPDSASFTEQAAAGKVLCPVCGSRKVVKAPMAPNVATTRGRSAVDPSREVPAPPPVGPVALAETATAGARRRLLRELPSHVEQHYTYVRADH